eukprot:SAG31_NODE_1763_length_7322_cov_21.697633_5_plen_107_part_00
MEHRCEQIWRPSVPKYLCVLRTFLKRCFATCQSCGEGIADVIFGAHPPAGKMPVTVYASPEQVGNITNMDMSKGRTYRYLQHEPLYPFGYGLSECSLSYITFCSLL